MRSQARAELGAVGGGPREGRASWVPAMLSLMCRALVAGVLLWAGLAKASDRQSVVLAVDSYRLLPRALVTPVAAALPWIEIALGLFLLLGLFTRFAGISATVLVSSFLIALIQAKARGLQIECGCFGGGGAGSGVSWWDMIRDLPPLLSATYLALRPRGPIQLDRFLDKEYDDG